MATRENIVLPKVTRELISADPSTWAPKLTTACPVIDRWLRGGVPTRHVTELTGEAGAAKTQLALQLLLNAQLPREVGGLDGAAVYVHTEGRAPLARLRQMISKREIYSTHLPPDHDPLDYVYLVKTLQEDPESLWDALASVADVLTDPPGGPQRPVRLIVVDSVSSPFRETDVGTKEGVFERTGILSRVAALVSEYAHRADVAVVVTNHVSDAVMDDGPGGRGGFDSRQRRLFGPSGDLRSSGRPVQPALGLFWANCVNTRVFLSRTGGSAGGYDNDGGFDSGRVVRRHASVVFSSYLPSTSPAGGAADDGWGSSAVRPCEFEVREDGVWGVDAARGEEEKEEEEEEEEEEKEKEGGGGGDRIGKEKEDEEKRRRRRDGRGE
jgi:DNA-repair protein XRCC3